MLHFLIFLIVMLIVVIVFGRGLQNIAIHTQERSVCIHEGMTSCRLKGILPDDWNLKTKSGTRSCAEICKDILKHGNGTSCEDYGW